MGGGKLHMVALPRIRHTAPCQEGSPEEGHLTAFLLHNRVIHMQRQGIPLGKAEGLHDGGELPLLPNLKHQFPRSRQTGITVKVQIKGLLEQLGQHMGKLPAFGDDFDAVVLKAVAVEQDSEALGQGAAGLCGQHPADFRPGGGGKRQIHIGFPCIFMGSRSESPVPGECRKFHRPGRTRFAAIASFPPR